MLDFKTNIKVLTLALGISISSSASAWIPCRLICDLECMGASFAVGSIMYSANLAAINSQVNTLSKVSFGDPMTHGSAIYTVASMGTDISNTWQSSGTTLSNLINLDKPLVNSLTGRVVDSVDAINLNFSQLMPEHIARQSKSIAAVENALIAARDKSLKIYTMKLINSETPKIVDNQVQNSADIYDYYSNKRNMYRNIFYPSIAYNESINDIEGMGSKKEKFRIEAIENVSDFILGPTQLKDEDYEDLGFLRDQAGVISIINASEDWNTTDSNEFLGIDFDIQSIGSLIDLQGLQVNKMHRRNLYLLETLHAKNFINKEFLDDTIR